MMIAQREYVFFLKNNDCVERESIAGNEIGYIEIENNEDILKTKLQVGIHFFGTWNLFYHV